MNKAIIAIAGAGLLASACASDPYGGTNQTVRQGAIGAGLTAFRPYTGRLQVRRAPRG